MTTQQETYSPGLEGVIAGETAVSTISLAGAEGLTYRGYSVTELAEEAPFEEDAYLRPPGALPAAGRRGGLQRGVAAARRCPEPLRDLLRALPRDVAPMDAVRSAV